MWCMPFLIKNSLNSLLMKQGTIVCHYSTRNTKLCEEGSKLLDGAKRCRVGHGNHFNPFSVCIHHHKKHDVQHRASKVQMKAGPRLLRPTPWLERCLRRCRLILLALLATADNLCHILIHPRPPHVHPSQTLYPSHTG